MTSEQKVELLDTLHDGYIQARAIYLMALGVVRERGEPMRESTDPIASAAVRLGELITKVRETIDASA